MKNLTLLFGPYPWSLELLDHVARRETNTPTTHHPGSVTLIAIHVQIHLKHVP